MTLDSQNLLQVIKDFPNQCREALSLPKGISASGDINNIVITGMGGSAVGGDFLKVYFQGAARQTWYYPCAFSNSTMNAINASTASIVTAL